MTKKSNAIIKSIQNKELEEKNIIKMVDLALCIFHC